MRNRLLATVVAACAIAAPLTAAAPASAAPVTSCSFYEEGGDVVAFAPAGTSVRVDLFRGTGHITTFRIVTAASGIGSRHVVKRYRALSLSVAGHGCTYRHI